MEKENLAMEMLRELKQQSKRKDIIIVILICVICATIFAFFLYESQFETLGDQTIVDSEGNGIATYLQNSESGDINYGKNN